MRPADITDPSPVIAVDSAASSADDHAHALSPGDPLGDHLRIVKLLGAGGMGEVYLARDARLERDVAIKVVHPMLARDAAGRERLMAEARAMARLGHPNVVAVHEVGEIATSGSAPQIFIAMEYVDGPTLRGWLPGKRPADVVRAFASCAAALAAAHRAGIVHGDFKPDNVLVGADGRARVADFGLAHTGGVDAPRGGTPAFMAPELAGGRVATAASDQYALCVALRDALAVAGKLAWVAPIVARGTAAEPGDRFPSLDAVASALARDPAARRRWAIAGGVALAAVAAIAGAIGFTRGRAGPAPCEDDGAGLAGVWDPAVASAIRTHFAATGAPYAGDAFSRVSARLDGYRDAWSVMRHDACVATAVRGDQSAAVLDLRMQCLDRRRSELAALTARLASDAKLEHALDAAASLPAIADCADTATLGAIVPPPPERRADVTALGARIDELRTRVQLGGYGDARATADAIVADARTLGYAPQLADALLIVGDVARTVAPKAAEAAYREAITAASRGRDDALAARAWIALYGEVSGIEQKLDEAPELEAGATAAVARAGDPTALRVRLLIRVANTAHDKGQLDAAAAAADEAIRLAGDDASSVASALMLRAMVQRDRGDLGAARTTARAGLAQDEAAFGPTNPMIVGALATLANLARLQGDLADADAQLQRGLAIDEAALGSDSLEVARLLTTRGTVLEGKHELAEAERVLERALAIKQRILGPDHREVANTYLNLAQIAMDRDDYAASRDAAAKALAIYAAKLGDHPQTAVAAFAVANADRLAGRNADARAGYQRALAIYDKVEGDPLARADVLSQLAMAERADHRADAAIADVRQALELRATHPSRDTVVDLDLLGELLFDRGDVAKAEAQFEAARAVTVADGDAVIVIDPLLGLAHVMLATKRAAEAVPLIEQALAAANASTDPNVDTVMRADVRLTLAHALVARSGGDRDRALVLAREARQMLLTVQVARPDVIALQHDADALLAQLAAH